MNKKASRTIEALLDHLYMKQLITVIITFGNYITEFRSRKCPLMSKALLNWTVLIRSKKPTVFCYDKDQKLYSLPFSNLAGP